ncbi:LacI family DNA-binding transcriptional regulator [bacterium AH-315-E10]|nr:LacI family DNA-binding transcriptional regulator [bacterium AH-315-E10]
MLKHVVVKKKLLAEWEQREEGDVLPTVRTLTDTYKISLSTLNRALSDLETEGLIVRKQGCGIIVVKNKARILGDVAVLVPSLHVHTSNLILAGIDSRMNEHGARLLVQRSEPEDATKALERFAAESISELIIKPSTVNIDDPAFAAAVQELIDSGVHVVCIEFSVPGVKTDFVGHDNRLCFGDATQHLVQSGCKRIGISGNIDSILFSRRVQGVREVLVDSAIHLTIIDSFQKDKETLINEILQQDIDGFLLGDPDFDHTFCQSLITCSGDRGKKIKIAAMIPEGQILDVNDIYVMEKPSYSIGQRAADILLQRRKEADIPAIVEFLPVKSYVGQVGSE